MNKQLPKYWRLVALLVTAAFASMYLVNYISASNDIAELKAEAAEQTAFEDAIANGADPDAPQAASLPEPAAEAWSRTTGALNGVIDLSNFLLLGVAALVLAAGFRRFWGPNTLHKHRGDSFNRGWQSFSDKERTRWVLGITVGILLAALIGR